MANPKIRLNFETAVSFTNNQPVLIETAILPYNNRNPNNFDISGALFIFRIQYEYTQARFEEDARYVNIVRVTVVIFFQNFVWLQYHFLRLSSALYITTR